MEKKDSFPSTFKSAYLVDLTAVSNQLHCTIVSFDEILQILQLGKRDPAIWGYSPKHNFTSNIASDFSPFRMQALPFPYSLEVSEFSFQQFIFPIYF